MNTLEILVKQLDDAKDLPLPKYMTEDAAGMDLYANITNSITLNQFERILIKTGIAIELPSGYEAQIRPRSGLALKYGITVLNTPGTIDADYRGEVGVILINLGREPFTISRGDRIAQMVINKVEKAYLKIVDKVSTTERNDGGFGHTDK